MLKLIRNFLILLTLGLTGLSVTVKAEDIDIYVANAVNTGVPNVLFVFDNGANFEASAPNTCKYADTGLAPSLGNTSGGIEQCALFNVVYGLADNALNIGLMVFEGNGITDRETKSHCGGNLGGCLVQPLRAMSGAVKTEFLAWIKTWCTSQCNSGEFLIKANTDRTGQTIQEAWAYYAGATGFSGRDYAPIKPSAGCQKNFVIFIGNAVGNSSTPGDGGSPSHVNFLAAAPGVTQRQKTNIVIPSRSYGAGGLSCGNYSMGNHNVGSGLYADEWSRYMYETDIYGEFTENQGITTYTIGLLGPACKPDYPALLTSMANVGGGKYIGTTSYDEIKTAIDGILSEVQAVNSVFSSASLPVSVNAQGTFDNQIYLGMFRPDATGSPRWVGNLKQYQFVLNYPDPTNPDPNSATLLLGDAAGKPAISSAGTGFITPTAISFWTTKDAAGNGFFVNDSKGAGGAFDSPDGEMVDKGGVGQSIRSRNATVAYSSTTGGTRTLLTCLSSGCVAGDLTQQFSPANTSLAADNSLGTTALDRADLINWVRGADNKVPTDEKGPGGTTTIRPSVHGDVLHSRPVVINYGDTRGTVVFYGGNDGVYRAVNGSQTLPIGSIPAGGELWGFILPEHFGALRRQRVNAPELKFPSTTSALAMRKDYFADGPTGVYQKLKADGSIDKAYVYLTMRRGGRFIYALDVTEPTAPKFAWKIDQATAGFGELGQTWSRPRVTLVPGYANPVLVFGAGYAGSTSTGGSPTGEDAEPPAAYAYSRGVFMVDAVSGARVWSAVPNCNGVANCLSVPAMAHSVPTDISFLDRNNDGKTDRLYFGDTGGNVWRADVNAASIASWTMTKLAALGCAAGNCASGTTPRKFFFPPSVVSVGATGASTSYDAVLIASGDREHPLMNAADGSAYNVSNRFFLIKDTATSPIPEPLLGVQLPLSVAVNTPALPITVANLDDATSTPYAPDTSDAGYYLTFGLGEKAVSAPVTVSGKTYVGTNQPVPIAANSCASNLGKARGYAVSPFSGSFSSTVYDGGGMPPTATTGYVTIKLPGDKTVTKQFCIGCGGGTGSGTGGNTGTDGSNNIKPCNSALENCANPVSVPRNPRRTYWYKN